MTIEPRISIEKYFTKHAKKSSFLHLEGLTPLSFCETIHMLIEGNVAQPLREDIL